MSDIALVMKKNCPASRCHISIAHFNSGEYYYKRTIRMKLMQREKITYTKAGHASCDDISIAILCKNLNVIVQIV